MVLTFLAIRLKQFDKNGEFEYSYIVSIRVERKNLNATLHPNPTINSSLLNFTLQKASKVYISVYDGLGKILLQMEFTGQEGVNRRSIDLSSLKNGEFKVSIKSENSIETLKLIKAK